MSTYSSEYWADKGYPDFTKSAAKDEGLPPRKTKKRVKKAHRVRAGVRFREAQYHHTIHHEKGARRDVGKALGDLRRGIFGK